MVRTRRGCVAAAAGAAACLRAAAAPDTCSTGGSNGTCQTFEDATSGGLGNELHRRQCEEFYSGLPSRSAFFRRVEVPPEFAERRQEFGHMLARGGIHPRGVVLASEFYELPLRLNGSLLEEEVSGESQHFSVTVAMGGRQPVMRTPSTASCRNTFASHAPRAVKTWRVRMRKSMDDFAGARTFAPFSPPSEASSVMLRSWACRPAAS